MAYFCRRRSRLELAAQKIGGCLDELGLDVGGQAVAARGGGGIGGYMGGDHATDDVTLADDGHSAPYDMGGAVAGDVLGLVFVARVEGAALHDVLQGFGEGFVGVLPLGDARTGDDGIAVADGHGQAAGLMQGLGVLPRKGGQLPDGGIFLEDDLSLAVGVDLQGGHPPESAWCGEFPWG